MADRITFNSYDAAGQLLQEIRAYGITTANGFPATLQQNYASYGYSANGRRTSVIDANGNRAEMTWDGYDRQRRWIFPSSTTAGVANQADYEEYGYDANGNRTSLRKRDNSTLTYQYDNLNRMILKVVPSRTGLTAAQTRDVYYGYDLRNAQTYARFDSASGEGVTNVYDGFGQQTSTTINMDNFPHTNSFQYDAAGNRTVTIQSTSTPFTFTYDARNRMTGIYLGLGTATVLTTQSYDSMDRLSGIARRYGDSGSYSYDAVGRLSGLGHDFAGTSGDVTFTYARNPASQITSRTRSNDIYAWGGAHNVSRGYTVNGLNQYRTITPSGDPVLNLGYDPNGNLTSDGSNTYVYDVENRLVSASGAHSAGLRYDPLGRLYETSGGSVTTRFVYDGDDLVDEYSSTGAWLRRFVHGGGTDDPLVWYEGSDIRFPHTDERGSVIGYSNNTASLGAAYSYDEWGIPGATNQGRFQYTGQAWIPELGMYYYKARIYSPTLGRFMQTDPIGYQDQINLYEYVGDDPVNHADPSGTSITEIVFLIYDVATTINHVANGASAGEFVNDAVNIGLDLEPIPFLREVKGGVEVARTVEHGVEAVRAERGAERGRTLRPGPHAREGTPASGPRATAAERRQVNAEGDRHGCHTCGAPTSGRANGSWIPDHQRPSALNPNGTPQRLYPHCDACSRRQAGEVTGEVMRRR